MKIKHDTRLVDQEREIVKKGYGRVYIDKFFFDRFIPEEEREKYRGDVDEFGRTVHSQMQEIMKEVEQEFPKIMQYNYDGKDYCLFFYSNRGWNGKDYYDYMILSGFNGNTDVWGMNAVNLLRLVSEIETKNVTCRVQYAVELYRDKLELDAQVIGDLLVGKKCTYNGMIGKVEKIQDNFYFKKQRARKYHFQLSPWEIISGEVKEV